MEFPFAYLNDVEHHIHVWVDCLAFDDLQPFDEREQRPPSTQKQLIYVSAVGKDVELKRLLKAIKDGCQFSFRDNHFVHSLNTSKQTPFPHWTAPLTGSYHHLITVHPAATSSYTGRSPVGYLFLSPNQDTVPTQPPVGFFEAFNRLTTIPLKPSWEPLLWTLAVKHQWVLMCPGYRSHIMRIEPQPSALTAAIQHAIATRQLS
jgi:hypothetical protein